MRKIKEVLRLRHACGLSEREIARSCQIPHTTVGNYVRRAELVRLSWAEAMELPQGDLEARLFPEWRLGPRVERPMPDCQHVYDELRTHKKLNLTLSQLWLEYKEQYPDGYQYTQFCQLYRGWREKLDYCMRQDYRGGEKAFVDYCDGLAIIDARTGEVVTTQLFVVVWGASNYTYAEASLSQELPRWIGSHVRAFEYFKCAPRLLVPDNLKSGVGKACFYEPELNPTYADMASHYGCAVLPTRPRRPRDNSMIEQKAISSSAAFTVPIRPERGLRQRHLRGGVFARHAARDEAFAQVAPQLVMGAYLPCGSQPQGTGLLCLGLTWVV